METYGAQGSGRRKSRCDSVCGFTLLELVIALVIIGVLAIVFIPRINKMLQESRTRVTQQNLAEIKKAIIGDPSINLRGFRQITGTVPSSLSQLWNVSGSSAANPFQDQGQGQTTFVSDKVARDGWGGSLVIGTTTDGDGILISPGPNGSLDGGGNKDSYSTASQNDDVVLVIPES